MPVMARPASLLISEKAVKNLQENKSF